MTTPLATAIADATATLKAENDRADALLARPGSAENPSPFVFAMRGSYELDQSPLSREELHALDAANREEDRRARRAAARWIIAEAMLDTEKSYERLREWGFSGEVAAKLYATWHPTHKGEPVCECEYAVTGIYADLEAAMNAHGLATYDERCAEIGKRLVDSCRDYIFAVHAHVDAEDATEIARERLDEQRRKTAAWARRSL